MEKAGKPKKTMLKYLPKVSFQNPLFSPSRLTHAPKGFSGPIIPDEARRKSRSGFEAEEPTSPKVSCMGQIKIHRARRQSSIPPAAAIWSPRVVKKHAAAIRRIFGGAAKTGAVKSGAAGNYDKKQQLLPDRAPSLGQMRRFASGRDVLANFDWTAVESHRHRNYHSDEERGASEDDGEEVTIPFSAPMGMCVQPRKQVNLWKRRTMAPPRHLQLHGIVASNS